MNNWTKEDVLFLEENFFKDGLTTEAEKIFIKEIIKDKKQGKDLNILDIGCGTGRIYQKIQTHLSELDIYEGIDTSDAMLDQFKLKFPNVNVSNELNKEEPIEWDYVICTDVIQHLDNPLDFIEKLASINSKKIFISFPCTENGISLGNNKIIKLPSGNKFIENILNYDAVKEIAELTELNHQILNGYHPFNSALLYKR